MTFSREEHLASPVARFLRNRGFANQLEEVQFYEHRMDLYAFSRREDLTAAVELKLRKWARALEQALLYQLCSDLVYIAMPLSAIERVDKGLVGEFGIGLLSVERRRCRELLKARPSGVVRRHYRDEYLSLLRVRA